MKKSVIPFRLDGSFRNKEVFSIHLARCILLYSNSIFLVFVTVNSDDNVDFSSNMLRKHNVSDGARKALGLVYALHNLSRVMVSSLIQKGINIQMMSRKAECYEQVACRPPHTLSTAAYFLKQSCAGTARCAPAFPDSHHPEVKSAKIATSRSTRSMPCGGTNRKLYNSTSSFILHIRET